MEKFIKLHRITTNCVVILNINEIVCVMNMVDPNSKEHSTQIWLKDYIDGSAKGITINESAEKVYAMIEAAQNSQKCDPKDSK